MSICRAGTFLQACLMGLPFLYFSNFAYWLAQVGWEFWMLDSQWLLGLFLGLGTCLLYLTILELWYVKGIANTELQFEMAMRDQIICSQREAQRNMWNLLLSLGLDEKQLLELTEKQGITIEDYMPTPQVGVRYYQPSLDMGCGRYSPSSCSTNNKLHTRAPCGFPQHQNLSVRSLSKDNWTAPGTYCGEEHHSSYYYMSLNHSPAAYMRISRQH